MPTPSEIIATALNPTLTLLLAGAPFYTPRPTPAWEFWARSVLSIGLAVVLAESGKRFEVWPGHPSFPSGHESFALAAVVSLTVRDRRWLALGLPLALLMSWALVDAHFHTPVDVAGAWFLAPPCALLCQRVGRRRPGGGVGASLTEK